LEMKHFFIKFIMNDLNLILTSSSNKKIMKKAKANPLSERDTRASFIGKIFWGIMAIVFPFSCKKENSSSDDSQQGDSSTKVIMVKNGTVQENISKLLELSGGISKYILPTDVVVLKCNAQWPNQGYTNTECIKYVIDAILSLPNFSGEILICDNIQNTDYDSNCGFLASAGRRNHNWADYNWETLSLEYQKKGYPVSIVRWKNDPVDHNITGPADGPGWIRSFFSFHGRTVYLSYPIFESPINPGRLIDMKNGVWEKGKYTGRRVRAIFMPTLNNHGEGAEDYAGVTSAIKCFFGTTEIHNGDNATIIHNGEKCYHIHSATFSENHAYYAGELVARYIKTMYAPALYITCAIWSGHESRTGTATETRTVLACENPVTLDYVSCKEVISLYASWLDPDKENNTRNQILGCISGGIGTIDKSNFRIVSYKFG